MVYFLLPHAQSHTIGPFLDRSEPEVRERVEAITLDRLVGQANLPTGTYVFSGLCVGSDVARRLACHAAAQMEANPGVFRVVNDPRQVLWRYELHRKLYEAGINRYRAFRHGELATATPRFPVFLRSERMHTGALTPILHNPEELRNAYALLDRRGIPIERILTVEYLNAPGPDGLFRKYTAYRVGDALIPRYVTWSPHWVVKRHPKNLRQDDPEIPRLVQEEFDYARSDPYREVIRAAFDLANIEYGRIDFTVYDGSPQIWEINTAPLLSPGDLSRPQEDWLNRMREPTKDLFYERFFPALLSLEQPHETDTIDLSFEPGLIRRFTDEEVALRRASFWLRAYRNIRRRWPRSKPFRAVELLAQPLLRWLKNRLQRRMH